MFLLLLQNTPNFIQSHADEAYWVGIPHTRHEFLVEWLERLGHDLKVAGRS